MSVRGAVVVTLLCLCMMLLLGHLNFSRHGRITMWNHAHESHPGTQSNFLVKQALSREADVLAMSPRRTVSPAETLSSCQFGRENMTGENVEDRLSALRERWERDPGNDPEEGRQFGNQSGPSGDPARRLAVVVFAQMRTGSSFTGQLFNQNPSFFYMFEPLWHLHHPQNVAANTSTREKNSRAKAHLSATVHRPPEATFAKVLGEILSCDFGEFTKFIGRKGLFKVGFDQALTRFCDEVLHWPPRRCAFALRPQTLPKLVKYCKRTPYTAVKTIRIQNMDSLEYLLADPTLDLKIVHLVRDPRAIMTSRLSLRHRLVVVVVVVHCFLLLQ
ncbi:CHST3 [Branchiostoma lanceolatum]|uniref:CHST3 protein n=1 Tax=Branchiostoma lanceolatum TaxID=7740 RepID=A0A8J9VRM5_BRALA|nr:CHST3 [Branchiostoma lanceolatum]